MARFQLITGKRVKEVKNAGTTGTLMNCIEEIEGMDEAVAVQEWSKTCVEGEYYEGVNFEIICLG